MRSGTLTLKIARGKLDLPTVDAVIRLPRRQAPIVARLGLAPLTIGSDPSVADVVLADPRISRSHASVQITELGLRVKDLGSKNGISLGATRVFDVLCGPEDTVTLAGAATLGFQVAGAPAEIPLSREAS